MTKRITVRAIIGVVSILLLIVAYAGLTLWRAGLGLPQWQGRVEVAGLDAPVTIVRDEHGVPYIRAAGARDLYFAQGFVHAQDRFWQMGLVRRKSAGKLAEWFGSVALRSDRRARVLGVAQAAERSWREFPEAERPLLQAYADGVNAWLGSTAYRRPPEMVILHVDPEPWQPSDAFLIHWQIYEVLAPAGNEFLSAVIRAHARNPEVIDIFGTSERMTPPIIAPVAGSSVEQPTAPYKDKTFSDNWTLSGVHTASGLPLMANDPQLPSTLPNFWQLQQHSAGDMAVAGATVPGLPGVVAGHNASLAWGETNALIDVIDAALVELRPDHPEEYRRGPGAPWRRFQTRSETIHVRFGRDVVETVRSTRQGVIWPAGLAALSFTDLENVAEELRYHGLDLPDSSPAAILRLNQAATVAEAIQAGEDFSGPPLNFSFADTGGNIGYLAAGRIPDRPETHARTVGLGPDDANARTYLPFSENPRVVNPPSGRIVTANQRIIGDEYPHYLTDSWAEPGRALRIHELLDKRKTHDVRSFHAMQMNVLSPPARRIVPLLLGVEPQDEADAELVRILEQWDHGFTLDASAPVIFLTWVEMLSRHLVDDELGPEPILVGARRYLYSPVEQALSGHHAEWCDDVTSDAVETCSQLLTTSLSETRAALEEAFGTDPDRWAWGDVARFQLPHLGFAALPWLGRMFSRTTPMPGGLDSLFTNGISLSAAPHFSSGFVSSSYQAIYDLSDLEASEFMMSGGQSGHFKSPFYNNLTAGWIEGERIRLPSDPARVRDIATLTLTPSSGAP